MDDKCATDACAPSLGTPLPPADKRGVMLDLETLGTRPGCVILSIGALAYDTRTMEAYDSFAVNLNVVDQIVSGGFTVDDDTVKFWRGQKDSVLEQVCVCPVHPKLVLKGFVDWCERHAPSEVVSRGTDFDLPILRHALEAYGFKVPWHYRTPRDLRTILSVLRFDESTVIEDARETHHTAIGDCKRQLRVLAEARASRKVIVDKAILG